MNEVESALRYHARTKHQPGRYAASLGYLDWANQPDPFRRYTGAPRVELAQLPPSAEPYFDQLYAGDELAIAARSQRSISQLLYDSLALSAWKQYGATRWSLRVNPSSGNLHPTEGYLLLPPTQHLCEKPALFHYDVYGHALEQRAELTPEAWSRLTEGLPAGSMLFGLSSIHWREAWKYGERAYRYCQHDVGHAIAALSFSAHALGWQVRLLEGADDDSVAALLGIAAQTGSEAEHADGLLCVTPRDSFDRRAVDRFVLDHGLAHAQREFLGKPNALSSEHHAWEAIDEVARACIKKPGAARASLHGSSDAPALPVRTIPARQLIRARRSAVDMDGRSSMSRATFFRMLERSVPTASHAPWTALTWQPAVHLALFVHRVEDLAPGLYFLFRDAERADVVGELFKRSFEWVEPEGTPDSLLFLRLIAGDTRNAARTVCCQQEIAANGAFAVAMMAELAPRMRSDGAHMYRRLHWEAGAIGQVLYLEAEAAGLSGTGIGCFFDDLMHNLLGVDGDSLAMLYGFTVGARVDDGRLSTLLAYAHLADKGQT